MSHYFDQPPADHKRLELTATLRGRIFHFVTDRGVFSRRRVDPGTALLIKAMDIAPTDTVLDLGCGYGPLGIVAAHLASQGRVHLVDRNPRAVELANMNLALNSVRNAEVHAGEGTAPIREFDFDVALINPPIRMGRHAILELMRQTHEVVRPGGRFYFVARTRQGAKTLAARCAELFGRCEEIAKGGGYRVYRATKAPPER